MDLAILNGTVVVPDNGTFKANVYVRNGKIAAVSSDVFEAKEVVNADGKYVAPGIIDPHLHFGISAPFPEEAVTESRAALAGGVTTVGDFFGGPKPFSEIFPGIKKATEESSFVNIIPHFSIAAESQLAEIGKYVKEYGVTSFKVYMNGVPGIVPWVKDNFILRVCEEIKKATSKGILCCHTENGDIVEYMTAKMKKKKPDTATLLDWADTHPAIAETEALYRLVTISDFMDMSVYMVHIVRKESVEMLSKMRFSGKKISAETVSPYLCLNKNSPQGNSLKMEPPFQGQEDTDALWNGIARGVIDTIGTDNVTNNSAEKNLNAKNFWDIGPGYPAVEHHLPVCLHEGVIKRKIPIERVIACMTKNPAKKFGVYPQKGSIMPGSDADLVVIDLNMKKEVKANESNSRSDYCIYEGLVLEGWPVMTIKDGVIAAKDGKIVGKPGSQCMARQI